MAQAGVHFRAKPVTEVDSAEGQALLCSDSAESRALLHANWIPQRKAHCGCASSVVVLNTLFPEKRLTQDSFFRHEGVAGVVPQTEVFVVGYTLDQLADALNRFPSLSASAFRAGDENGEYSSDQFRVALAQHRQDRSARIILNFSARSLRGAGIGGGHFTPVWDFNARHDRVLILEVCNGRKSGWYALKDMWHAMACVDDISARNRGWIVLRRENA